jgi:hypothetical protein
MKTSSKSHDTGNTVRKKHFIAVLTLFIFSICYLKPNYCFSTYFSTFGKNKSSGTFLTLMSSLLHFVTSSFELLLPCI